MKKRILTLLTVLALVLALGMLAACGGNGDEDPAPTPEPEQQTQDPTPDPVQQDDDDDDDEPAVVSEFAEHIVISMGVMDAHNAGRDWDTGTTYAPQIQYLLDRFNISFDYFGLEWGDFIDVNRNWLATGIAPDVIFNDISIGRFGEFYVNATRDGFFRPINLDNNPNLRAAFENGPTAMQAFMIDGNLYAWAGPSDMNVFISPYRIDGIIYRRDWAVEVGHAQDGGVYTYDQWVEMIQAVQEANPGGVTGGVIGTASVDWAFPRDWPIGYLMHAYNQYLVLPDGSIGWGPAQPESTEIVRLANQLFHDGIIWPDQMLGADHWEAFTQGSAFSLIHHGISFSSMRDHIRWYLGALGEDADDEDLITYYAENVIGFALVENPRGEIIVTETQGVWSQTLLNANMSDEAAARFEALLDFLVTEEGYLTKGFGIRGTHWDYDANGNFVLMWERDENGVPIDPFLGYNLWPFLRIGGNMDARFEIFMADDLNQVVLAQHRNLLDIVHGPRAIRQPFNAELAYFIGDAFLEVGTREGAANDQVMALLVAPPDAVEGLWEAWVESQMPMIQPVLDELNAALR